MLRRKLPDSVCKATKDFRTHSLYFICDLLALEHHLSIDQFIVVNW